MASKPKSPAKHKLQIGVPEETTQTALQKPTPRKHESPRKEKVTCLGCDKQFLLLLSHLERTKSCQSSYDIAAMRKEADELHRQQMAARKLYQYQNDPNESPRKRAASMEYYMKHTQEKKASAKKLYQESPEKKKEAMAAYNEKHKEAINKSMRNQYYQSCSKSGLNLWTEFMCQVCENTFVTKKALDYHVEHSHMDNHSPMTCQICENKFVHKQSLERHTKEVHGGVKHICVKCPAAFTRHTELEKHINEGWHYLNFYCKQCKKTLVFKHLGGLINHVIVKQSVGEVHSGGETWKEYKSGILVTCKSQVESTQLKEGKHVLCMPRKEKVEAAKQRERKKEEIINEGLQLANSNAEFPRVNFEFEYKKHEDDGRRKCKWCYDHYPYSSEQCAYRKPDTGWHLQRE